MRKRDKAKMDRALARAPAIGGCPKAPPRAALARMVELRRKYHRMAAAVRGASVDLGKATLKNEDLAMRVAHLEKKLADFGHAAD